MADPRDDLAPLMHWIAERRRAKIECSTQKHGKADFVNIHQNLNYLHVDLAYYTGLPLYLWGSHA